MTFGIALVISVTLLLCLPIFPLLSNVTFILATLPAEHQKAHIAKTIGKRQDEAKQSEKDIIANMFKHWHNGEVAMQSLDYYKNDLTQKSSSYLAKRVLP